MYTPELILAMQCQAAMVVAAVLVAVYVLRVPWTTAFWAGLLFNSIPVLKPPGYETQLFIHDLLWPVLALLALLSGVPTKDKLLWLVAGSAFLWPLLGVVMAINGSMESYQWVTFAWRRCGFVVFFLAGLCGLLRGVRAAGFLEVCVLIWTFMMLPALLQYFGYIDTDIHPAGLEDERGLSIWESATAQRGFLGLNRGAVGVWGSAVGTYCLAQFFLGGESSRGRWLLYPASAILSYSVILFSGTRTGLLAALGGAVFVVVQSLFARPRPRMGRVLGFAAVTCFIGAWLLGPMLYRLAERFNVEAAVLGTGQARLGVQSSAIAYVLNNPHALLLGMGPSEIQFYDLVGQSTEDNLLHPHSEVVEMLWQGGVIGLGLYLGLLWALFVALRPRPGSPTWLLASSGRAMLVAGIISGLAVGNIMISTMRLAAFGLLMAFVYGRIIRETRAGSCAWDETTDSPPDEEMEMLEDSIATPPLARTDAASAS